MNLLTAQNLIPLIFAALWCVAMIELLRQIGDMHHGEPIQSVTAPPEMDVPEPFMVTEDLALAQIEHVNAVEIPELELRLPYESWHDKVFEKEDDGWRFRFLCNFTEGQFAATALGRTPREAFTVTKHLIMNQIANWHKTRFNESPTANVVTENIGPRVLIVDDDVDLALAMQTALRQMGYRTEVATQHEDLHRRITFSDADYIFLDWKLNGEVTADLVVEKAMRLIDTFSDLREKFSHNRPRIVTHSILGREHIQLPDTSDRYFNHLDHWQKPLPFHEVAERVSGLTNVH